MRQTFFLCNVAVMVLLSACASDLPEPPQVIERSAGSKDDPQVLPSALRRAAYDAPDFGTNAPPVFGGATLPPAPEIAVAPQRFDAAAPYQPPSPYVDAGPVALEQQVMPAPAASVPSAQAVARQPYTPRTDLSALDPVITTPGRAPRGQAEPPPARVAVADATRLAAVPAELAPRSDDFTGTTESIMAVATPTAPVRAVAPASGRYAIHLASYRSEENVARGWDILRTQHADMLGGLQARGAAVDIPGRGEFIRLIVGPFATPDDARLLCAHLKSLDEYCNVVPFDGTPVL